MPSGTSPQDHRRIGPVLRVAYIVPPRVDAPLTVAAIALRLGPNELVSIRHSCCGAAALHLTRREPQQHSEPTKLCRCRGANQAVAAGTPLMNSRADTPQRKTATHAGGSEAPSGYCRKPAWPEYRPARCPGGAQESVFGSKSDTVLIRLRNFLPRSPPEPGLIG
jgi:hypothetical protein